MKFVFPEVELENVVSVDFIAASSDPQLATKNNSSYFDASDGAWWSPRY